LKFNRYSYKSDVWAIGVIAFELVYGQRPWKDKDDDILYEKIMKTSIDELFDSSVRVSEQYKQFIRECLQVDFERRAGPEYVINFNWLMANDYIEGLDEPTHPHPQHLKPLSINKLPHNASVSAKHMAYKSIQF
jgi:serine/threonine protein kinase